MSKFMTYTMIVFAMITGLSILGVGESNTGSLLNAISYGNLADLKNGLFYTTLLSILALGGVVAVVGFITNRSPEAYIVAPLVTMLVGWIVTDLILVYTSVNSTIPSELSFLSTGLEFLVFLLIIGFLVVAINYWRGND